MRWWRLWCRLPKLRERGASGRKVSNSRNYLGRNGHELNSATPFVHRLPTKCVAPPWQGARAVLVERMRDLIWHA